MSEEDSQEEGSLYEEIAGGNSIVEEDSDEDEEVNELAEDVQLLEVDDGEIVEEDVSDSDFESLPPPIHIPDALRPVHMRGDPSWDVEDRNAGMKKKKSIYDDSSSDDDDDDDDDDDTDSKSEATPQKPKNNKPLARVQEYNPTLKDDDSDSDDSSDDDGSLGDGKGHKKGSNGKLPSSGTGASKNGNNDSSAASTTPTSASTSPSPSTEGNANDEEKVSNRSNSTPAEHVDSVADASKSDPIPTASDEKKNGAGDKSGSGADASNARVDDSSPSEKPERIPVRSERLRGTSFDSDNHDGNEPVQPTGRGGRKPANEKDENKGEGDYAGENTVRTPIRSERLRGTSFDSDSHDDEDREKRGGRRPNAEEEANETTTNGTNNRNGSNSGAEHAGSSTEWKKAEVPKEKELTHDKHHSPVWHPPKKEEENPEPAADESSDEEDDPNGEYYTITELRKKTVPGLDYLNREKYLRAAEFKETLGCKRKVFNTWPKWKQTKAKRAAKLF
ncbi:hypothetical protein ACA910_016009 [Epithemia clementina (nom. ined.)]